MFRFFPAAVFVLVLTAASASAQTNFVGWERQYAPQGVQLLSPKDERQLAVAFAMTVAADSAGDPADEFAAAAVDLIAGLGAEAETLERSGVAEIGGMILEALKLERNDGVMIDLLLTAYPVTGGKWQIAFMMYPSTLADADPRVVHALDFLATAFNAKYGLLDPQQFDATAPAARNLTSVQETQGAPSSPAAPASTLPPTDGKTCQRRPIWGPQISAGCQPSGVCNNLIIKDYETVCE